MRIRTCISHHNLTSLISHTCAKKKKKNKKAFIFLETWRGEKRPYQTIIPKLKFAIISRDKITHCEKIIYRD